MRVDAVADDPDVHGLAHISGGGVRNLPRLRTDRKFVLDSWPRPAGLFEWIVDLGDLDLTEAYQTFNMGVGFVLAVDAGADRRLLGVLGKHGAPDAKRVGTVELGRGVDLPGPGISFTGYHDGAKGRP